MRGRQEWMADARSLSRRARLDELGLEGLGQGVRHGGSLVREHRGSRALGRTLFQLV